jgi:hypothetical protein
MKRADYDELVDAASDLEEVISERASLDICPALRRRLFDLLDVLEAEIAEYSTPGSSNRTAS